MKTKKTLIIIIVAVLVLAAGGFAAYKLLIEKPNFNTSALGGDQEVTLETKVAVGILKLENTELAVTAEQAKELLPLWKGVRTIGASEMISDAEMDALYDQIQETLTSDQMAKINSMDLENMDMATLASDLGVSMAMGGRNGANPNVSEDQIATRMAQNSSEMSQGTGGGFAGGNVPPGGGGQGGGQGGGMDTGGSQRSGMDRGGAEMLMGQGTQTADSTNQTGITQRNQSPFLNAVIVLLTERAAE
jgi:hypothetical protein